MFQAARAMNGALVHRSDQDDGFILNRRISAARGNVHPGISCRCRIKGADDVPMTARLEAGDLLM
jgi:hypothetical protein